MFSPFGKVYDHFSDIIMALVVLGVFYKYNPLKKTTKVIVYSIILFLLAMTYVSQGCLNRVLEEEEEGERGKVDKVKDVKESMEGMEKNLQNKIETMMPKNLVFSASKVIDVAENLHDKTFDDTKKTCMGDPNSMIKFTKYFGGETYTLFLMGIFLSMHFKILK